MKHRAKYAVVALCALLTGFIFSCKDLAHLELPESISIKSSDARYSVPVGNYSVALSDYLNAKKLQKKISKSMQDDPLSETEEQQLYVYDYNPNGIDNVQEFIIHYPITTISLNPYKYLKDIGMDEQVNDSIASTITIPGSIAIPDSPVQLPDLQAHILKSAKPRDVGFSLVELGNAGIYTDSKPTEAQYASYNWYDWDGNDLISVERTFPLTIDVDFQTLTFSSGYLEFSVNPSSPNTIDANFTSSLAVEIIDADGNRISSSQKENIVHGTSESAPLRMSLQGCTFVPDMRIRLIGYCCGGNFPHRNDYTFSMRFSDDVAIQTITDLNMTKEDLGENGVIQVSTEIDMSEVSAYLAEATIQTGELTLSAELPSGWQGVKAISNTYENGINVVGGLNLNYDVFEDVSSTKPQLLNKRADLAYKVLKPAEETTVSCRIGIALEHAVIDFSQELAVALKGKCTLKEAATATVYADKLSDMAEETEPVDVSFPDSMTDYIQEMKCTLIGMSGTLETDFPADALYMQVTLVSDELGINMSDSGNVVKQDETFDIHAGTDTGWAGHTFNFQNEADTGFSLVPTYSFTGANGGNIVTLTALEFDKEYSVTPNMELLFDWEYIVILTSEELAGYDKVIDTGLNIGSIFDDFLKGSSAEESKAIIDQIYLTGIEGYIYVTKPKVKDTATDPLASISQFTGSIKVTYTGNEAGDDLIDPTEPLLVKQTDCDFASLADSETLIITDTRLLTDENYYSTKTQDGVFCDILNKKPDNLSFLCNLAMSGMSGDTLTLYKKDFDSFDYDAESAETQDVAVKISLALRFPLALEIIPTDTTKNYIEISDVRSMFSSAEEGDDDDDLLNRDSIDDKADYRDYTDLIRFVQCTYDLTNRTGFHLTASMVATNDAQEQYLTKTLDFNAGEHSFYLTREEIASLFDNYPFAPKINMAIQAGMVRVPRNASLGMSAVLTAETDGTYEIWSK